MENSGTKQTVFDTLVTDKRLQLIKAVLPYIDFEAGKTIAMFVKFQELKNTINLHPGAFMVKDDAGNYKAMHADKPLDLNTLYPLIKDYLSDDEREMFDSIMGMMDLFSMDEDSKEAMFGDYMDMFKDML